MPKFTVSYSLRYDHVVLVGVEADDADDASSKAQAAFDDGTIWDDTSAMPLLMDDWTECDNNTLMFEAVEVAELPPPDSSVAGYRRHGAARRMLELLRRVAVRCPVFLVPDVDLPTHTPVTMAIDDIRDVKACVASLEGC
jgi:hypothetical protein